MALKVALVLKECCKLNGSTSSWVAGLPTTCTILLLLYYILLRNIVSDALDSLRPICFFGLVKSFSDSTVIEI